ncbi:MAG: hypothetical protein P8186_12920 [Anaerolineae bacterium]|jgi:hypothetical protein
MQEFLSSNKDLLDVLIQLLIVIIPILLTWFIRTYVKSTEQQKRLATIVHLSNAAIDYAEDLQKRGDLDDYLHKWGLSDDVIQHTSSGIQKLNIAGKFAEQELDRMGIKVTDEEAQAWIAAEFQKRIGDIGRTRGVDQRIREALSLLQALQRSGMISLPTDTYQATQLADHVASWAIAQTNGGVEDVLREGAVATVKTELAPEAAPPAGAAEVSPETQLRDLARQSVAYVEQLKRERKLTLSETDLAVAWMLTEVTQQGLNVTPDQIAAAVRAAFAEKGAE